MTLNNINEILNSIQKNLKAPKDKENKFGNFVYRNAEGILEAYKEEISKDIYPNDLTLTHSFKFELIGIRLFVFCTSKIELSDGTKKEADGFAEIDVSKKGMDQSQLSGAVTSYAKKYALCNLFAIDDSKDDPDADEKPKDNKGFFKEPIGALSNIAEQGSQEMQEKKAEKKAVDMQEKLKKEEEGLERLKTTLAGFGSVAEIEGYLNEVPNGSKSTRLQAINRMSEINAGQAKVIIRDAKFAVDPQYKGE
jgi:hypothetical protein